MVGGQPIQGTGKEGVRDRPGRENLQVQAVAPLPSTLDSTRDIDLLVTTELELKATGAGLPNNGPDSFAGSGIPTHFAVYDARGEQVTGFTMKHKSGHTVAEKIPEVNGTARAVEYYFEKEENYFVTSSQSEAGQLDLLVNKWQRTGESFKVYVDRRPGTTGICRFYSGARFGPDFAHQYVPQGAKCDELRDGKQWIFEGIMFYMPLPDATGACAPDHIPVYQMSLNVTFNQPVGDSFNVPSFRLTTSREEKMAMLDAGWRGGEVAMCSPR